MSYDKNTNESGISNSINAYTKYDPTLPHVHYVSFYNKECISNREDNGKQSDVIYIRYNDNDMKYLYMCVYCDKVFLKVFNYYIRIISYNISNNFNEGNDDYRKQLQANIMKDQGITKATLVFIS